MKAELHESIYVKRISSEMYSKAFQDLTCERLYFNNVHLSVQNL